MWSTSSFFKDKFIDIGGWDLVHAYKVPHVKYLSADTETKLYYQDKLLSEDDAYNLYKENGQTWCKKNLEVRAYAFMLADDEHFLLFQNIEDFLTACSMLNVQVVFWYNAKFDFAIFDYYFLTNDWQDCTLRIAVDKRYKKLPDKTYQSLNGDFGQRYQMTIWKQYINKRNQSKVHKFKMIDICNIFGGGLAKNLKDWDIKDNHGNDIRKLEMDYVQADIESDLQYMINDTKGLYFLSMKINDVLGKITGFDLLKGQYMTAGGLAKKTLLKFMFGDDNRMNIKFFKKSFPLTVEEDAEFRSNKLYLGGKCLVNNNKIGVVQKNIYKYDVNSMYPTQMRNMAYPYGVPTKYNELKVRKGYCYILCIDNLFGTLKYNMCAIWQDAITGDYVDVIREEEKRYIWLEELQEIEQWYDLEYDILFVLEYKEVYPKGTKQYIDTFYDIKSKSKGAVRQGAKLLLNSAYGKIAQRIEREICVYELDDETGSVHLVKKGFEKDEKSMLSVVVGSRITSLSRVLLLHYIRDICGDNVSKNFIYCDTDSVHALCKYDKCNPTELGAMDFEGKYKYGLYLAPKSYLLYDGSDYEVHTKGVNTKVVYNEIKGKSFNDACEIFAPNRTFRCLSGLNVHGGKALLYVDKMIVNDKNMEIVKNILGDVEEVSDNNY